MLILSCSSKLRLLETTLRGLLPETLPVLGAVMSVNRGNPAVYEVLVDSWPKFKAVLLRPCKEMASDDSDFYTNTYAAYYQDLGTYRALLDSAINWSQAFCIHGLQDGVYEASRDISKSKGIQLEAFHYITYLHPDPSSMPEIRLDPAMRLSSLDISHTDLLNETWPYGGNERSRRYLTSLIRYFPSVCLLDPSGRLVSWNLSDPFGVMKHGYTMPQHRGSGYIRVLMNVLAKRMHTLGYPSYLHVAPDIYPVQRLGESLGFQRQPCRCLYILHNTTLHRTPTLTPSPALGTAPTGVPSPATQGPCQTGAKGSPGRGVGESGDQC